VEASRGAPPRNLPTCMPRSASPSRPQRCAREGPPPAVGSRVSTSEAKRHVAQPSPCGEAPGVSCTEQHTHKEGHQLVHRDGGGHTQPAVGSLDQLRRRCCQSCVVAAAHSAHTSPATAVQAQPRGRGAVVQAQPAPPRGWLAKWCGARNTSSMRSSGPARGAWRAVHGADTPGARTGSQYCHTDRRAHAPPGGAPSSKSQLLPCWASMLCGATQLQSLRCQTAATSHMRLWEGPPESHFLRLACTFRSPAACVSPSR
jgi:hypothetical protein